MKFLIIAVALLVGGAAHAAEPLAAQARAALEKSTAFMRSISTEGGYLWRYSPDLKEREGEEKATPTQIWVQPPGTPAMGMAFLRMHEVTGDARYLDAAKAAAAALAAGQLESGGWFYYVDFDQKLPMRLRLDVGRIASVEARKRRNISTYDDDNTQSALRFLVAVSLVKGAADARDARIREARDYGFRKLIEAQRPNGGWPQRWNGDPINPTDYPVVRASIPTNWAREWVRKDYQDYYTLNDNVQPDIITTLLDAYRKLGTRDYLEAAKRGGDFLLLAQLPEPQPAWAQQYNRRMEPEWGRVGEPPAVASAESTAAMRALVEIYLDSGDRKYLESLPRAIAWFKRSEIEPNRWARLYELGTNRPIYGLRDGKLQYNFSELPRDYQTSYAWQGEFRVGVTMKYIDDVMKYPREKLLERRGYKPPAEWRAERSRSLEPKVKAIVAALDTQGRWISQFRGKSVISTDTFITNVRTICDYLEAVK